MTSNNNNSNSSEQNYNQQYNNNLFSDVGPVGAIDNNSSNDSMINDLFQNDFPSTLPISQRELKETVDAVESNHFCYSSQFGSSLTSLASPIQPASITPPPIPPPRASSLSLSPPAASPPVQSPNAFQMPPKASPPLPVILEDLQSAHSNTTALSSQLSLSSPAPSVSIPTPTLPRDELSPVSLSFKSSASAPVPRMSKITTTEKEVIQFTKNQIQSQIYKENNDVQFNMKSNVLFGVDNESTSREVLEGG